MSKRRMLGGSAVLVAVLCFLVSAGWAADCTCGSPGDLQQCINSQPPGTAFTVHGPATCYENLLLVSNFASLVADNSKGQVVIEAADANKPVISVVGTGYSGISGFTIRNGTFGIQWNSANGYISGNTIQNSLTAGILVGGGYIFIGANSPNDLTYSPNSISGAPVGVQVTERAGASIVGNKIYATNTGIVVDSASQADIAGNTIQGRLDPVSVTENSVVRLSNRPGPLYGPLNKALLPRNSSAAVSCGTGACVTGLVDGKMGFSRINSDQSCIHRTWTNTDYMVGTWKVIEASVSNLPVQWTFYANGYGQAGSIGFTWDQSKGALTLTMSGGKFGVGELLPGVAKNVTWKLSGTIVNGEGTIQFVRQ
jgi:hypothetical protein